MTRSTCGVGASKPSYPEPQSLSAFDHVAFDRAILALSKEAGDLRHHDGLRMACARLADHLNGILKARAAGVEADGPPAVVSVPRWLLLAAAGLLSERMPCADKECRVADDTTMQRVYDQLLEAANGAPASDSPIRCPECKHADSGHFDGCTRNFIPSAPTPGMVEVPRG